MMLRLHCTALLEYIYRALRLKIWVFHEWHSNAKTKRFFRLPFFAHFNLEHGEHTACELHLLKIQINQWQWTFHGWLRFELVKKKIVIDKKCCGNKRLYIKFSSNILVGNRCCFSMTIELIFFSFLKNKMNLICFVFACARHFRCFAIKTVCIWF